MDYKEVKFESKREKSKENKKVTNIFKLVFMFLKGDNQDLKYYSEELGCSVRTIKEYIKILRQTFNAYENKGFKIIYEENRYKLDTGNIRLPVFTPEEIESLHMAVLYLEKQKGTPFEHLEKIEKNLQKYFTKEINEKLNKKIDFAGPETYSRLSELLHIINEAINRNLKLTIGYIPTGYENTVTMEIIPSSLYVYDYEWYLRGFCLKDKKVKNLSINQIVNMLCGKLRDEEKIYLSQNFNSEAEHNWDWYNKNLIGGQVKVLIEFTGRTSVKLKKKLKYKKEHPTQKVAEFKDRIVVSYEVKNPLNMLGWILKFGSEAKVIEPDILRTLIKKEINKISNLY